MTENKRFRLAFEDFDGWGILDTTGEYSDDEDYIDWLSGQKAVDVLNYLSDDNKELRQRIKSRLHYYRELANNFDKDDKFSYNIIKRMVEDLEDILK